MKRLKSWYSIGQSATEYAVLLALVAAALIAMQVYLKRGMQGRIKDLADQISAEQYEAGRTVSQSLTDQEGITHQEYTSGVSKTLTLEESLRGSYEEVSPEEQR